MREQLETALRANWTRETLVVYSDFLQLQNDPRGELIAIDLHAETHGMTTEVEARRASLLDELLGALASSRWLTVELGFVRDLRITERSMHEGVEKVLDTPLGGYVQSAILHGEKTRLKKFVTTFARYHHLWLRKLEVVHAESFMTLARDPIISPGSTKKLVAATPALELLVIGQGARDRPVFPPFTHPTARIEILDWRTRGERR